MSKKAADAGTPDDKKTTTKLPEAALRKARAVAAMRGIDLYDYLASIVEPAVNRDFERMYQEGDKKR